MRLVRRFFAWLSRSVPAKTSDPSSETTVMLEPVDVPPSLIEDDHPTPPTALQTILVKGKRYTADDIQALIRKIEENSRP